MTLPSALIEGLKRALIGWHHIQLQEDALESILEMNLERIQHARGKGKKQVAVFEYATSV